MLVRGAGPTSLKPRHGPSDYYLIPYLNWEKYTSDEELQAAVFSDFEDKGCFLFLQRFRKLSLFSRVVSVE